MSVFSPVQTSFAGGELSKRLRGRVDADLYKVGLAECSNFEPLPQGSLRMRAGTEDYGPLTGGEKTRLVRFRMSDEQDYLLELVDRKLRIYDIATGKLQGIVKSELLQNGDFAASAAGWTQFGGRAPVYDGLTASLHYKIDSLQGITQEIEVPAPGSLTVKVTYKESIYDALWIEPEIRIGTVAGGSDIFDPNLGTFEPNNLPRSFTVTVNNVPAGTYHLFIGTSDVGDLGDYDNFRVKVDDVSCFFTRLDGSMDEIETPWTQDQLANLHIQADTGEDRVLFAHPNVAPWFLQYRAANDWSYGDIAFQAKPAEWAGGNWPHTVEVYSGRAYWAIKNRLWGSRAGTIADMTIGSNPGDALDYKAATKGVIRWMQGQRTLLMGTDISEHSVTGSSGIPLVGDISIREESAFGSARVQALNVGTNALFVTADRREVRALAFDLQTDGWDSKALTFVAEHITKDLVKEILHVRHPESAIILVLDSGTLALCTYDPAERVVAWWRVDVGGLVRSAAASQGPLGAYLWMAVQRGAALRLERLALSELATLRYLDASVERVVGAGGVVAQLGHLEGATVSVVGADDAVLAKGLVVAGGQVVLEDPELEGETVVVGLPYRAKAVTLPREGGNPRGTAQGAKRRNVRVRLRLNDSAIPLVDGDRAAPDRSPSTPMGSPEPLMSGDVEATCLGWGDGAITIEQDLPLRTEILAIFANTAVHDV